MSAPTLTSIHTVSDGTAVTCPRCSHTTTSRGKWLTWTTQPGLNLLVVAGINLALCPGCAAGHAPPVDEMNSEPCGGTCDGDYRPTAGIFWVAEQSIRDGESWACWDMTCVEGWANENSKCDCCDRDIDIDVTCYRDGKKYTPTDDRSTVKDTA